MIKHLKALANRIRKFFSGNVDKGIERNSSWDIIKNGNEEFNTHEIKTSEAEEPLVNGLEIFNPEFYTGEISTNKPISRQVEEKLLIAKFLLKDKPETLTSDDKEKTFREIFIRSFFISFLLTLSIFFIFFPDAVLASEVIENAQNEHLKTLQEGVDAAREELKMLLKKLEQYEKPMSIRKTFMPDLPGDIVDQIEGKVSEQVTDQIINELPKYNPNWWSKIGAITIGALTSPKLLGVGVGLTAASAIIYVFLKYRAKYLRNKNIQK